MTTGVIYYCGGLSMCKLLETAVWSLRRYYRGSITIFTNSTSTQIYATRCTCRFGADVQLLPESGGIESTIATIPEWRNHRFQHRIAKVAAILHSPYDRSLYLDLDTLVFTDPSPLIDTDSSMVLTEVVDGDLRRIRLNSSHKMATWTRQKLERIASINWVQRQLVQEAYEYNPPLVNTGVIVASKNHPILLPWLLVSISTAHEGVCDQYAITSLIHRINDLHIASHVWNAVRGLSGRWNSPDKLIRHYTATSWRGSGQWKKLHRDMVRDRSNHAVSNNYVL